MRWTPLAILFALIQIVGISLLAVIFLAALWYLLDALIKVMP